ncbi:MAG: tRNA (N6-threonylcarbamoyladenosine(37)-N6)-methyltransferase TrmO [Clostridia bacterium]|nr:tRNA (N6-threonylcarbamoyladenosine(37)-N6)-methyltransferase TrmO [Clostridia bacterium]
MKIIARIHTDFKEKFGIPRQSGLAEARGRIVFEPEYRAPEALRGLEGYSHLWIIWEFSEAKRENFSPTVRPPRLGGNTRVGVFATRSPYRPNPIGLSSVKLERIENTKNEGCVLHVLGADMLDGTPIYDIKPYLPFTDCHADAVGGFSDEVRDYALEVQISGRLLDTVDEDKRATLIEVLRGDPRPSYKADGESEYGMRFAEYEVKFAVSDGVLTVKNILKIHK